MISKSEDGTTYILKCWFAGRECDIRRNGELLDGVKNLAKLHLLMKMDSEEPMGMEMDLKEEYIRHNREMNKVRKYVRTKSPKGEFELAFLKHYEAMYEWGRAALACVENSKVKTLYQESVKKGQFTHGDYNYHNILMTAEGMGTTNFDKFRQNVQVEDLYYFLRKAMEKHGWNRKLGDHMLNAYSAIKPLSEGEMEYLKLRLIYPEKFWKIADTYYRSNKAWISAKNVEKLKVAITQTEEKSLFLENLFSFHL